MSLRRWTGTVVGQAAALGSLPSDSPDERLRKSALVLSSLLITMLSFIWIGAYAALGLWRSALIPLAYQVASLVGLAFFARTKRYAAYRAGQVAMMLLLPFLLQWSLGRFVESGAVALWAFVAPLGALVFYGPREAIAWFGGFLALVALSAAVSTRRRATWSQRGSAATGWPRCPERSRRAAMAGERVLDTVLAHPRTGCWHPG